MHSSDDLLAALSLVLPRISEEGADREEIPESDLVNRLLTQTGMGSEHVSAALGIARRLLQSLSLLDERRLTAGEWVFVSFPAFLCARSLLAGLATDGYRLLDDGFWSDSEFLIDRQRSLIRGAEQRRISSSESPTPIRNVFVSWAVMSLDGRFLLVRREDPNEHREGSRGQFVLPGGRVSPSDLQKMSLSERLDFFDPLAGPLEPSITTQVFERAIRRELSEELELSTDGLTSVSALRDAIEYTDLEGAKSAHALTSYVIQLFRVKLSTSGKSTLLRCLARNPNRFAWFTLDELVAGHNSKGQTAFVNALSKQFPTDLGDVLDSDGCELSIGEECPIGDMLDIPVSTTDVLLIGDTGHERAVIHGLDEQALGLLGWLAAIRRGDPFSSLSEGVSVAGDTGWVLIEDSRHLAMVKSVANVLNRLIPGQHLIDFHECAIRLNTCRGMLVNFSPSAFSLDIVDERRGKTYRLRVKRREINSELGTAEAVDRTTRVSEKLGAAIYGLAHGDIGPAYESLDTVKRVQRTEMRDFLDSLGIRLLVRQVDGVPELAAVSRIPAS